MDFVSFCCRPSLSSHAPLTALAEVSCNCLFYPQGELQQEWTVGGTTEEPEEQAKVCPQLCCVELAFTAQDQVHEQDPGQRWLALYKGLRLVVVMQRIVVMNASLCVSLTYQP